MFPSPPSNSQTFGDVRPTHTQGKARSARPPVLRPDDRPEALAPYGLTPAEMLVLDVLADGATNEQIAATRECSVGTVKVHLGRVFRKVGVRNRGEAIVVGRRLRALRQASTARAMGTSFELDWILEDLSDEHHPRGTVLFHTNDPADALYFVHSGEIVLPEVQAVVSTGEVFGEIGIFSRYGRRTSSAVCATPVRLFRVGAERVWDIYAQNAAFALHLLQLAANRLATERARPVARA